MASEQPAAPAPVRPPSASALLLPPSFVQDPAAYLVSIALESPSPQGLAQLAGSVAAWFQSPASAQKASQVANIYLQATAKQLKHHSMGTAAAGGDARLEEIEMIQTQQRYEVMEAIGVAATQCIGNRLSISSSGILLTLGDIMLNQPNELQQASVEFLQCAILAEQYRYAARLIQGTWPRPTETSSVKQVLRYYYLRGMIHLGCNDYVMAHRSFWTCLSIPAESCSKIMLEAWKKLALVQCLLAKVTVDSNNSIQTPNSMPTCMARMLSSYREAARLQLPIPPQQQQSQQQQAPPPPQPQPPNRPSSQKAAQQSITCYMDFVDAFYKRDKKQFQKLVKDHEPVLRDDGNAGLVNQCLTQLVSNEVLHLSYMYSVVPVSKVASLLGLEETSQVSSVLLESKVPCQIQDDGMVVFQDVPEETPPFVDMAEWMQLIEKVQKLDVTIITNPRYYALMQKETANRKEAAEGPRGVEDF